MEAVRTRLCHFFERTNTVQFRVVRDNPATPDCILNTGDTTLRTINFAAQYPGTTMDQGSTDIDPFGQPVTGPSPTSIRFEPRGIVTTAGGSTVFVKGTNDAPLAVTVTARVPSSLGSDWAVSLKLPQ